MRAARAGRNAAAAPGDPPSAEEVAAQTRRFAAVLGKRNRERMRAVVRSSFARHAEVVAANVPRRPVACSRGCDHCCRLYVSATAPELFLLAEHVAGLPDATRTAIESRVAEAAVAVAGRSTRERALLDLACPMLGPDGACQAYEARPLACRAYGSFDRGACERGRADPGEPVEVPTPRVAAAMRRLLSHCLRAALAEKGLDARAYELVGGLARVLATPRAEIRWLAGEDVLTGVQHDPRGGSASPPGPA